MTRLDTAIGNLLVVATLMNLVGMPLVSAQDAGVTGTLEEVIVTAARRQQNIQDVPIAITVLSGEALDKSGVENTIELQYRMPGLVIKTNSILGQPYLRGVGSDLTSSGVDPAVAVMVDGVSLTHAYNAIQDLYDVERIEIIKGPQGTLYGRNATGGIIHIITNQPAPGFDARADVTYGNYNRVRVRGMVNTPVLQNRAQFRVAGLFSRRDGFVKNSYLNENIDNEDFRALRAQLRYEFSGNADILISGVISRQRDARGVAPHPDPGGGISLALLPPFSATVPADPREVRQDFSNYQDVDTREISARITWNTGPVILKSISAYHEDDARLGIDLDATEIPMVVNRPEGNVHTITQELQLLSNTGTAVEWVAGFFFLSENTVQQLNIGLPLFNALNQPRGDLDTTAYAIFGQLAYAINGHLRATAGLRYSNEQRSMDFRQSFADPSGAVTGIPGGFSVSALEKKSWDAYTPRFALEYTFNKNIMVYASAARGFKAGGFNTDQYQAAIDPEYIWAYELGIKTTLAQGRVHFNTASFYYDYTDMQLLTIPVGAPPGTFPVVVNAPAARIRGLETELTAEPVAGTRFDAALTLLDAEFRKFTALDPNNPALGEVDRKGMRMPQAPELSFTIGGEYTRPCFNAGEVTIRGEYRYQSHIYFNTYQDPAVSQGGYGLLNAWLSFESKNSHWHAAVYGRNLLNKLYTQTRIRQDPIFGNLEFFGAPRTYGIQVGYQY